MKIILELLRYINMVLLINGSISGGLSPCSHPYPKNTNPYMRHVYDVSEELLYLIYYDINDLYGLAMRN